MRLSDLIEEFCVDCRTRRLSPKTVGWYASNLRYFLEWLRAQGLADDLAALTLPTARRYSQAIATRTVREATFVGNGGKRGVHALKETDRPLAANTLIGYLRSLKIFARWLADEEQGYLPRNVLQGLRLPKKAETHEEPLTAEETSRLLGEFNLHERIAMRDFAILLTYRSTGLRATELTDLLLDDVHVEEGYLRVRAGKGGKTRAVNLPPEAARAILRYRQHFRPETHDPHLFVTRTGGRLTYNAIKLILRRARRKSGIARLHTHLLRASFSVGALGDGMDLMTLKETLGHADIRTTAIYLKMSEQQLIVQQRKANALAGVTLPKAVRRKA